MKKAVKAISLLHIAAFQLVGYSVWSGEAVSSNLTCYTNSQYL